MSPCAPVAPAAGAGDVAAMRAAMERAQRVGRRARLRVQVPCMVAGAVVFVGGALVCAYFRVEFFAIPTCTGFVLFFLCVTPSNERHIYYISGTVAAFCVIAATLYGGALLHPRLRLLEQCTGGLACREVVLDVVAPILNICCTLFLAVLIVRTARRKEMVGRALLEALWRVLATVFVCIASVVVAKNTILAAWRRAAPSAGPYIVGAWLVCLAAAIRHPTLKVRLRAALAARGEALLTAASVAVFIGDADAAEMVARAQGSFRVVPISLVKPQHLEAAEPDPALFNLSAPAMLGQCDAFVSHSWADDPLAKYETLRAWGRNFERQYARAPLVWLDRYCLPQDRAGDSVLLPIYLAGCSHLLALAGGTYLTRLWCIVVRASAGAARARCGSVAAGGG